MSEPADITHATRAEMPRGASETQPHALTSRTARFRNNP